MKPLWIVRYTDTHEKIFLNHFLDSWNSQKMFLGFVPNFHKEAFYAGKFGSDEFNSWGQMVMKKNLEVFKVNMGRLIVISGCDIRFYAYCQPEIVEACQAHEMVAINDVYFPACGDFNAFIVTPKIIALFEWMIENDKQFPNQEFTLNAGIVEFKIKLLTLPNTFWTVGLSNGGVEWRPGEKLNPPKGIKLHHGNFTIGEKNKEELMAQVHEKVAYDYEDFT